MIEAAQGDDGIGAAHGPFHAGLFEAVSDDGVASGLDDAGAYEQALLTIFVVAHPFHVVLKVAGLFFDVFGGFTVERYGRAGIVYDLFSAAPVGISAISMMAAVAVAVLIQRSFPESRIILPVVLGAATTVVFWFVYLLLLRIFIPILIDSRATLGIIDLADHQQYRGIVTAIANAYGLNRSTLSFILPMALIHSILILPIYWGFYGIEQTIVPRKVEI